MFTSQIAHESKENNALHSEINQIFLLLIDQVKLKLSKLKFWHNITNQDPTQ